MLRLPKPWGEPAFGWKPPSRKPGIALVAPLLVLVFEENTWATHAIGIFSHPASQGARSYLVDPASSHMLVSKIKPCMSKYKHYTVKLRMAH